MKKVSSFSLLLCPVHLLLFSQPVCQGKMGTVTCFRAYVLVLGKMHKTGQEYRSSLK